MGFFIQNMKNLLLAFLLPLCLLAQFSKTHYIPPVVGSDNQAAMNQVMYISSPSITPINFTISAIGGGGIQGTVSRDNPFEFNIGFGLNTQLHVNEALVNTILNNKGYIIEAEDQVYVAVRVTAAVNNQTGLPNQASGLVSKGLAALGKEFRIGAMTNTSIGSINNIHLTFVSVLATENNTVVEFEDLKPGISLINNATAGNTPQSVILNRGQSFTLAVKGPIDANRDGMIGGLVKSNKPIAVNCGSYGGTNGTNQNNLDLGLDQIVGVDRIGSEYIFVRAQGVDAVEKPLLVAHEDGTEIYINGNATPEATINAGEYYGVPGNLFNANGNMYVVTSKPVFAYQGLGGTDNQANQEVFFVPPLSCETPKIIDNIPQIDRIGSFIYTGNVNIVTKTGATLNFIINGVNYTSANLPGGIQLNGPFTVTGNLDYVSYTMSGLGGNVSVFSSESIYLSYYGSNAAATYGGYYSGFTFKPEIIFEKLDINADNCIPNIELTVNTLSPFDQYQWYFNNNPIPGATTSEFSPTQPGYYFLSATLAQCGTTFTSDVIPVSGCTLDSDSDGIPDNIDIDLDNDGISNCIESYGNQNLLVDTTTSSGQIQVGNYNNSFQVTTEVLGINASLTPVTFDNNSQIYLESLEGFDSETSVQYNFANPTSVEITYIDANTPGNFLLNPNTEYIIQVPVNKTLTIINPNDQLLIDTNYDGVFENNINFYSSFEIRFRLNSGNDLPAGQGNFRIGAYLVDFIKIKQRNLQDINPVRSSFKLVASCVPRDSDSDGIADSFDLDSDNDGIPDFTEGGAFAFAANAGTDANNNGMDDAYENQNIPLDIDADGVANFIDLDSDNDGIYDLLEAGHAASDTNLDGIIDGNPAQFGNNGLFDNLETSVDSGIINYNLADIDNDNLYNYIDLDSDGDLCFDVTEAGFTDPDNDGILGTSPLTVNNVGVVQSSGGYQIPQPNYAISAPIVVNQQPSHTSVCFNVSTSLTINAANITIFQWQVSTDAGATWSNITNNTNYNGATTATLTINNIPQTFDNNRYRVMLNRTGNSCEVISNTAILTVFALPQLNNNVSLVQCDNDGDGISRINLTLFNPQVSANHTSETFQYYTNQADALAGGTNGLISSPTNFNTSSTTVWVRVTNNNQCSQVTSIQIVVSFNQIPNNFQVVFDDCDDAINGVSTDDDGTSVFNFSSIIPQLQNFVSDPSQFSVRFYASQQDAEIQFDSNGNSLEITNISNFRNTTPFAQLIWVRVENNLNNACFGVGPYVRLVVNPLPSLGPNQEQIYCSGNPAVLLTPNLLGANPSNFTYQWNLNGTPVNGAFGPQLLVAQEGVYTVRVTTDKGCFREQDISVVYSEPATIVDIQVIDLSPVNSITVLVSGAGDYEYALDSSNGPYQDSNVFSGIPAGIRTVFVRDKKGCGITSQAVSVLRIPPYFTPNGDGVNDIWTLQGANQFFYPNTQIYIFDRYGKLIKHIQPVEAGWDGTFQGQPLPSTDYWYVIELEDGRVAKGHFSLIR